MSIGGILHLRIFDHSVNAEYFNEFVEELLDRMNPYPMDNSVLVLDNASIHKSEELRPMIEARYGALISSLLSLR